MPLSLAFHPDVTSMLDLVANIKHRSVKRLQPCKLTSANFFNNWSFTMM